MSAVFAIIAICLAGGSALLCAYSSGQQSERRYWVQYLAAIGRPVGFGDNRKDTDE